MAIYLKNSYAFQNFCKHPCKVHFQFFLELSSGLLPLLQKRPSVSEIHSKLNIRSSFCLQCFTAGKAPTGTSAPLKILWDLIPTFENPALHTEFMVSSFKKSLLLYFTYSLLVYNVHTLGGIRFTPRNKPNRNAYTCSLEDVF